MSITFDNVTKRFGDTEAVSAVSFEIPSRTTAVLLGSSGCGKTTLMRMVNRMVDPTSGRVLIDDLNVADKDPVELRRSIGYVMQSGGLMPHWTVADNIATVDRLQGADKATARARAAELLEIVGLDAAMASRYPAELSGGQRQRVGVARALAPDPNILLMDEPFGAVDPIQRRLLQDELLRIQRELNKTILFVTHDVDEALMLGDEVIVLRPGARIAQRGTPAQLVDKPADDFVAGFIGSRGNLRLDGSVVYDDSGRVVGKLSS
ncbi:ABC transporter ATP-binding protein [Corynebacterium doosanense]|uniref:ABC-type quaternary amine transporter n=1 Tax=Corynebacterium doosanense CAU 212 = DSM 45436 TaxID=558173 RepID=A0A097IET8_9CORY|nr:ATP-binding cassette domain-containing protein [Corynebacterium doosanense]AIT60640.1 ABC transporter ATP-binding protein [Corynebacterium doosanense CAU 212 = DSM 45436]